MKRMCYLAAALVAVSLAASSATAQNLLANPSFEDPTVSMGSALGAWFRFGSGGQGISNESTAEPRSGARHISLETLGANQFAGVFQTLTTPLSPGQIVTFSGYHKSLGNDVTSEIKIEWAGAPQYRVDVLSVGDAYEPFSISQAAPAGVTGATITYAISSFGAGQDQPAEYYVDDFTVTVVPEPATAGMLGLGLVALARLRRRK